MVIGDYDNVIQQLEGTNWVELYNANPYYIRDACFILKDKERDIFTDDELFKLLRREFPVDKYWLFESRASGPKDKAASSRIECAITAMEELGLLESVEQQKNDDDDQKRWRLSYSGKLLGLCQTSISSIEHPSALNEEAKAFFNAYLLKLQMIRMAIEALREEAGKLELANSRCSACKYHFWHYTELKKLSSKGDRLLCPECGHDMQLSLVHKIALSLRLESNAPYWVLRFTKELSIFKFSKISNRDYIELR
jgi:hypothetical protein